MIRSACVALLLAALPTLSLGATPAAAQVLRLPPKDAAPPPPQPVRVRTAPRTPVRQIGQRVRPMVHPVVRLPLPPTPPGPVVAPPPQARRAAPPPQAKPHRPDIGTVTGLPLPRFASLRSDEVYLRAGPGFRYPVRWVYRRRGMPVEIEREFQLWRLVLTPDGARGWMHEATLKGRRDGIVTGTRHRLRAGPEANARTVAIVDPGVILRLLRCGAGSKWCRVEAGGRRGWIRRRDFWGTFPGEKVPDR
ncbi:MAG: SH3 domain-containing protein [Acetobacteraceae bacterium]